jgi:hypothetical protein
MTHESMAVKKNHTLPSQKGMVLAPIKMVSFIKICIGKPRGCQGKVAASAGLMTSRSK